MRSLAVVLVAAAALAQSPLTTTFLNNNTGAVGGCVYFDLNVTNAAGITINGLDLNVNGAGSINVYLLPGGRGSNQTNQAAWALVTSGTVTSAGVGAPSPVAIGPIPLAQGLYGIALQGVGVSHVYTNGTGPNQTVVTTEVTLSAGEASNTAFVAPLFTPRVVNTNIYFAASGSATLATNTTNGLGCIRAYNSFYQYSLNATVASPALTGNVLLLNPTANGYQGAWVPGAAATSYVAPVSPTVLATGDDGVVLYSLTTGTLMTPYGAQTAVSVSGNGIIAFAGTLDYPGTGSHIPTAPGFLNSATGGVYVWHDYNSAETGSGPVVAEEANGVLYVTYDGVENHSAAVMLNPSTVQFQFTMATGLVRIVFSSIDGDATSVYGSATLVGVTAPGPSADPGSITLAPAAPALLLTSSPEILPLLLTALTRPKFGTSWNLQVTNIPATTVFGVHIFGLSDPGIPNLFFLGLPTCQLRANLDVIVGPWASAAGMFSYNFPVPTTPPSLIGFELFTQAATFSVPPVNAFGAITSNGIKGKLGNL
ncbi:MAG: hypothetical protein ABIP94_17420 [Planctomycetota bacterium]